MISTYFQMLDSHRKGVRVLFWAEITLLATDKVIQFTETSPLHTIIVLAALSKVTGVLN